MRVKFSCCRCPSRTLGGRDGCVGVFFTDRTNTPNNFWPRNGLDIFLNALRWKRKCKGSKETYIWDVKQVSVKVVHIHETNDIQDEGRDLPGIERGEQQKEKERKTRKSESRSVQKKAKEKECHIIPGNTTVDHDLRQSGNPLRAYSRIIDASK